MKRLSRRIFTQLLGFGLAACGGGGGGGGIAPGPGPGLGSGPAGCVNGRADGYACRGISLRSRVSPQTMGAPGGNDLWGWTDPVTNREYALVGLVNGTAFVDVTNPVSPVFLGRLPTQTVSSTWRDIKVYADHAYIVADGAGAHGMQFFDLTRLRGVAAPQTFAADGVYGDFQNSHNLAINEATGFAYAVGSNTCNGGLHMVDIRIPNNPMFAGCHALAETHDTQCVAYAGPDPDHQGREICVSSNENHVGIADVTDKSSPMPLGTAGYAQLGFVHQGWLTEDHRFFLLGDELDEIAFGLNTRTHVFDVSNLDAPAYLYAYQSASGAVDHNLYVRGNRVYQANYASGLRVLEFGNLAAQQITEVAFFDTYPAHDSPTFDGAWSVYPYFASGTIIVNDRANGLFVLAVGP